MHNQDGSLDIENLSDVYLQKRAEMLEWRLEYIKTGKPFGSEFNTYNTIGNWDYRDYFEHNRPDGSSHLHLSIDGVGLTPYDHQVVFGSDDSDKKINPQSLHVSLKSITCKPINNLYIIRKEA